MHSSAKATTYEKSSKEQPRVWAENHMAREIWVQVSRVLGLTTDWFRGNVRVSATQSVMIINNKHPLLIYSG